MKIYTLLIILICFYSCSCNSVRKKFKYISNIDSVQQNNEESKNTNSELVALTKLIQGNWKYKDSSGDTFSFVGNKLYNWDYDSTVYTFEISYESYILGNKNDGIPYINGRSVKDSNEIFSWSIGNLNDSTLTVVILNYGNIVKYIRVK